MLLSTSVQGSILGSQRLVNNWKVLIYMQADNDLANYAFWDLAELESASNNTIPVLVELDLPGNDGIKRLKINPQPKLGNLDQYDFSNWGLDRLNSEVVKELQETEQTQQERLLNFIIEAEEKYPTEKTMLVIWGHGEGYGGNQLAQFGGVAIDDNPKSKLLSSDITDALQTYNTIFNKKVDILSMDACLMQTLEVAVDLNQSVQYLIGSTQIQNFRGLPYDDLLNYMQSGLAVDASIVSEEAYALALKIPEISENSTQNFNDGDTRTMSAVNLAEIDTRFLPELDKLGAELLNELAKDPFYKLDLLDFLNERPFFLGESRDISSLLSALDQLYVKSGNLNLINQIRKTREVIHRFSISYFYGENYLEDQRIHLGAFKAFGMWLPSDADKYQSRKEEFKDSRLYSLVPNWQLFLDELYSLDLF